APPATRPPPRSPECRLCSPNRPPQFPARMKRWPGSPAGSPLRFSPGQAPTTALARRIVRSLNNLALLTFAGRISENAAPGLSVLHCHCSCTHNSPFPYCDPRPDEGIGANPRLRANGNRRTQQGKIRLRMIVRSRAKMRAMRDRHARAECHAPEVVNKRLLADRAFIASLEIPGEINRCRWINVNAPTDLCSETSKQKSSPTKAWPRTEPEKRLRERPQPPTSHLAR